MEDKLFIDKLSGSENWATWKFQMEHLLKAKGLWSMVMETEVLAADANAQARGEFERRKEKAFSVLVLNTPPPLSVAPPLSVMSDPPGLADLSRLYQTEFVRSARAVGVLWAVCSLCFAIIQVVILVQPSWIGTTDTRTQQLGPPKPSGTMGLFEVCLQSDWPLPDCRGSLSSLSPLPSFQSVTVLVGVSLWAVWTSILCLCLFRFCSAATVYKICAWLQLTAGFCLALACLLFPDSWESPEMRALCGDSVGSFSPGNCSIHWAYILAILGILDYAILATLAFVLANRQDALLPPDAQEVTAGLLMMA
ncbi:LHFPL tetraspan subfamily member 3 protein isoform X3 [Melanotaenia boesemani]|uniref:LHFPL tetraspan subfamily member 3 protein isoform X3 n=1 Tax=Melanotaenia boesemani TaxID=1250792 RepID=UPI001C05EC35|nr:LHFPL tetraspan subfamily member 3 protein isoform X3 [Melanotaenia boesemani]